MDVKAGDSSLSVNVLAEALFNKEALVKVVAANSGEWFDIDMKKFYELDVQELKNFQRVFSIGKPGDNQVMVSAQMGMALITKFRRLLNDNRPEHDYILKKDCAVEIINILVRDNLIPSNIKFDMPGFKANPFFDRVISDVAFTLLNGPKLTSDDVFFKLDKDTQAYIVEKILKEKSIGNLKNALEGETVFSRMVKVFSLPNIVEYLNIRVGKTGNNSVQLFRAIFGNFMSRNFTSNNFESAELALNDFNQLTSACLSKDVINILNNTLMKNALQDRDFSLIQLLFKNKSKDELEEILPKDAFITFFAGITRATQDKIIEIYMQYSKEDLWTRDGIHIKSLYSQGKQQVVEHLLLNYEIDFKAYDALYKFMEKRCSKGIQEEKDFRHFQQYSESQRLEYEMENTIPVNVTISKALKF